MQLLYKFFYRQYGIRRIQTLISPRVFDFNSLPRNSLLHYFTLDDENFDVDTSKIFFANYKKRIMIDFPGDLTEFRSNPRKKSTLINILFRPFILGHKNFKYQKNHYEFNNDQLTLLVNNYNYLNVLYRYVTTPMTHYNRWWNTTKTMWDNIDKVASISDRNNFVFINIPKELPSYSLLKMYSGRTNISLTRIFDSKDKLDILELWKWLSDDFRSSSVMSTIKEENFNKVNIVFTNSNNKSALVNLGYLNSWIKGHENSTEFNVINQFNNLQMQKIFLKFLIMLQSLIPDEVEVPEVDTTSSQMLTSANSDDAESSLDSHEEDSKEFDDDYGEQVNDNNHEDYTFDVSKNKNSRDKDAETKRSVPNEIVAKANSNPDDEFIGLANFDKAFADIDEELKTLETINKMSLKEKGIHLSENGEDHILEDVIDETPELSIEEINNKVFQNKDFKTSLLEHVNEGAESGLLSASDYKKFIKDIETYSISKDPYGSGVSTLEKINIKPEDIHLNDVKTQISSSSLVVDKSMNNSSLLSYDHDYINKVLQRDVVAMVSTLQKSGVVIKNHEIENDNSILGNYEHHTIELKPIDGAPSSLHFRIPKINEDGSFVASNNTYSMRKQIVDNPIRKIDHCTVAMTSYYGKTFVILSDKKANSSVEWIIRQINKMMLEDSSIITDIGPANVFDNTFKAPYIYSALSATYKSFKINKNQFYFDHNEAIEIFDSNLVSKIETNGIVICGSTPKGDPIVVDKHNVFYIFQNNSFVILGDIYTLLNLNASMAPVDFTEVRIFSKAIPVGVVFGFFIGFKNLIKLLNAKYRIVEGRKNKQLTNDEYAVSFSDISYIFTRKDVTASKILSGFIEYEKVIKQYPSKEFNSKNIYFNLFESKGLSSIYIRELELTNQLFVDSITKSILEEMKEPTTFLGLLIKSTEMLNDYHHPDPQDMNYMRIRGYERLSGAIYTELVTAIRQYRNKNISGKSKIDMSPYQIWTKIMKDPALKIIEDINPIQNLKESEIVTYVGDGGRSKEAMNKESRAYHSSAMGVISEATVDSSDVGVNAYLSANPNFKNIRGLIDTSKNLNPTSLLSTSALLAPGATNDDAKRVE